MKQHPPPEPAAVDGERRALLAAARNAGAAGVAVAVLGPAATAPVAPSTAGTAPRPAPVGYHETEHIRKYYRHARY